MIGAPFGGVEDDALLADESRMFSPVKGLEEGNAGVGKDGDAEDEPRGMGRARLRWEGVGVEVLVGRASVDMLNSGDCQGGYGRGGRNRTRVCIVGIV